MGPHRYTDAGARATASARAREMVCAVSLLVACLSVSAWGCSVPVYRYALERWEAEPYELFVFHRGPLNPKDQKLSDALRTVCEARAAPLNLKVEWVDTADAIEDEEVRKLWESQKPEGLPWAVLCFPRREEQRHAAWSGRAEPLALQSFFDSPARREVAAHLLAGECAAWLLIESGDAKKDTAAGTFIETQLKTAEKELKLPKPEADDEGGGPAVEVRDDVPLRIAFSVVRVRHDDPVERGMLTLLRNAFAKPWPEQTPMLFVIFGQGRVLAAFSGTDLAADDVLQIGQFLIGPCSCTVKEQHPGFDMLMPADWSALGNERAVRDAEVPNLAVLVPALAPPPPPAAVPLPAMPPPGSSLARVLLLAGLFVLIALAVATLWILKRKNKGLA
jgi:hypothetical protein